MSNNKLKNLNVEGIEILFGWFLIGVAVYLHLVYKMDINEKSVILFPAILGAALLKVMIDSVSKKLIRTDSIIQKNLISLIFAIAIAAGTTFVILSGSTIIPQFISARITLICSVVYTSIIYFSGRRKNISRFRFYGYLTLILLIILNFRIEEPINRTIILLVTIGCANLILSVLSILKSLKK